MDEVGLGKLLQNARAKANLTQQELCHQADISYSTLAKIERGAIKAPSIFTIQKIAVVLGLTLDEMLGLKSKTADLPPIIPKKVSKTGIRFVYFDVNGCLVRFFHRALTRISEEFDASPDLVESTFWQYNDAVCRGDMALDKFNQKLAEVLEAPEIDWTTYYMEEIEVIDHMHELLKVVAENYHVGLLTNIMPGFIDEMLDRGLLPKVAYDTIIDSSVVGAIKPEEEIYQIAQNQSNCLPEEILLVDDSRSNIMAAGKLGWKVLWFDDYRPDESILRIQQALEFE